MASSIEIKKADVDLANSYLSLNQKYSPFLTETQYKKLDQCTKCIAQMSEDMEKMDLTQMTSALQQLDVFHKRTQKRQTEIGFIKEFIGECEGTQKQLKEHVQNLSKMEGENPNSNDPSSTLRMQVCLKSTEAYNVFLSGLKKLAEQTLEAFNQKKFDKGVRSLYPQMLKEFGMLLKKADLFQAVQSMPGNQIKNDLLSVLKNSNALLQVPAKNKFNSIDWILVLKGFSDLGAQKLLAPPEIVKENIVSQIAVAASNPSQFLPKLITLCEKKIEEYATRKTVCAQIASACENSQKPENQALEITAHFQLCVDYFSGLKDLTQQTYNAFQKGGKDSVKAVYPQMVYDFAELLKKAKLLDLVKEMPDHFLKDHFQAMLHDEQLGNNFEFDMQEWMYSLLGFQGQAENVLEKRGQAILELDINSLAEKVEEVVKLNENEN